MSAPPDAPAMPGAPVAGERQLLRSFRNRNFRLYFGGQLLSASGTFMQLVAQAWLVLSLGGDGVALGLLTSLQFLPAVLLFGPVGVILERVERRKLFLATQLLGCLESAALGLLVVGDRATLGMAFAFAGIRGCVTAFEIPVRSALVFDLVGPEDLANATGLHMALQNISRVVGPALAGIVIAGWGVGACFLLNAGSFLAATAFVLAMRPSEMHGGERVGRAPGQIREGLRYVRGQPELLGILVMAAVFFGIGWGHEIILPLAAGELFGGGAGTYALLTSALGVGSIAGGVAAAASGTASDRGITVAALGTASTMVAVAAAPTLGLHVVALVLMGGFGTLFMSLGSTRLQLEAEPRFRGRVVVLWTVAALGTRPIGGPITGWIAEVLGSRAAFAVSAASIVLVAVPAWRRIAGRRALAPPQIHTYTEELAAGAAWGRNAVTDDAAMLELLLEERAVLRTLHRYCHSMDYGLEEEWTSVFTDDGIFDVRKAVDGTILHREEGREELAAYIAGYPKPPASFNKHIMVDPLIEIDGDRATARSYWMALRSDADGHPAMTSFGRYLDSLAKVDGTWRIKERLAEVEAL